MKIYWNITDVVNGLMINQDINPQTPKRTGNNVLRNIIQLLAYNRLNNIKMNEASE